MALWSARSLARSAFLSEKRCSRAVLRRPRWQERPLTTRRFELGATLMTAVAVHVALQSWQGPDPGWLWLIIPTTAALIGGLLIAASRVPESH